MEGWNARNAYKQVSECKKPNGRPLLFECVASPTERDLKKYAAIIRSLREIPDEFIVFIPSPIWINQTPSRENEVKFMQMCMSDDLMRVEIRVGIDEEEPCKMYAHYCDKEEAISITEDMLRDGKCPDVSKWEDVTETIFGEREINRRKKEEKIKKEADRINNVGWDIHQGHTSGVPDPNAAIPYYEKAAALGSTQAMVNLGNIFEDKEDYEHAYYWYHEAAIADNEAGMFNLANMYHWGWYVKQDYQKAYEYFQVLHSKFCHGAAFYLGLYNEYGFVGEKNYKAAVHYYQEGLNDDDEYCAVNLGRMYSMGLGVNKDERKGYRLFLRGYKAGDELACCNLGYCFETGQGLKKNLQKALEYYHEGAERGEQNCIDALKRLEAY